MNNKGTIPIIILNWNGYEDTIMSVESALNQTYPDIVVYLIDNNSDNNEGQRLKEYFSGKVEFIQNNENLGFGRAHNEVIKKLISEDKYEYIALLNNDAFANKDWITTLVQESISKNADMVSSKIIKLLNQSEVDNLGHLMLNTGEIMPIGSHEDQVKFNTEFENFGACAGACLYSSKMLKNIGLFDDYFQTGYEDAELGVRAVLAGYKSVFYPNAVVYHKGSVSINKIRSYQYILKLQKNILYTYFKLMPIPVIIINIPFIFIKYIGLTITGLLLFKWAFLKSFYEAIFVLTFKELKTLLTARKEYQKIRAISSIKIIRKQTFFLSYYFKYFIRHVIHGKKTVFDA